MALNDGKWREAPAAPDRDPLLDRIYRESGRESPPRRLDAAILAAARREAGAGPRPLIPKLSRWRVPMSIAAVVLLSVSLVTWVQEEADEQLIEIPLPPPVRPAEQGARQAPTDAARPESPAATPGPPPAERRSDAGGSPAPGAADSLADRTARDGAAHGTGVPESGAEPQARLFQSTPRRAQEDVLAKRAPEIAEKRDTRDAPRRFSEQAPAPASGRSAAELPSAGAMSRPRQEAPAGLSVLPAWHDLEQAPPEKWAERIEVLRRQGRVAEADTVLAEFKRRFPGHPGPSAPR